MVKANEYREGIFVLDVAPYDKIHRVDLSMIINALGNGYKYRGIHLTREWLERCGFEKVKEEDSNSYQSYSILKLDGVIAKQEDGWYQRVTDVDGYYEQNIGEKLEFVHQLQNRYQSFTGVELNVKL